MSEIIEPHAMSQEQLVKWRQNKAKPFLDELWQKATQTLGEDIAQQASFEDILLATKLGIIRKNLISAHVYERFDAVSERLTPGVLQNIWGSILNHLTNKQYKEVILNYYVHRTRPGEIQDIAVAQAMDITPSVARRLKKQAVATLRREINSA